MNAAENERRDGSRIDLRLMVHYDAGNETIEPNLDRVGSAEASDLSARGLRLESDKAIPVGVSLQMNLSDGDEESISATGRVTWCNARKSPTGKTVYDTGVHFLGEWLKSQHGTLATALARLFAMGEHTVERASERVKVSINASLDGKPDQLKIADLSAGGMFACFMAEVKTVRGALLWVSFTVAKTPYEVSGRVAWVATADMGCNQKGGFGVQFLEINAKTRETLQKVAKGELSPEKMDVIFA